MAELALTRPVSKIMRHSVSVARHSSMSKCALQETGSVWDAQRSHWGQEVVQRHKARQSLGLPLQTGGQGGKSLRDERRRPLVRFLKPQQASTMRHSVSVARHSSMSKCALQETGSLWDAQRSHWGQEVVQRHKARQSLGFLSIALAHKSNSVPGLYCSPKRTAKGRLKRS